MKVKDSIEVNLLKVITIIDRYVLKVNYINNV